MSKLSDSPYFLLKEYFEQTVIEPSEVEEGEVQLIWINFTNRLVDQSLSQIPVTFSDSESISGGVQFINDNNITWNIRYFDEEAEMFNSYLIGPRTSMVTEGGSSITLYVEDENYGFRPVYLSFRELEDNLFTFELAPELSYTSGSTITTELSGIAFYYVEYDFTITELNPIDNGMKVYFRKDSYFHDWLLTYAEDLFLSKWGEKLNIKKYINTDKTFIYFGKIFKKSGNY